MAKGHHDQHILSADNCHICCVENIPSQVVQEQYKEYTRHHSKTIEFEEKQQPVARELERAGEAVSDDLSITLEITAAEEKESKEWKIIHITSLQVCQQWIVQDLNLLRAVVHSVLQSAQSQAGNIAFSG